MINMAFKENNVNQLSLSDPLYLMSEREKRMLDKSWAKNGEGELSRSLAEPLSRLTDAERKTLMESRSQKEIFEIIKATGLWEEKNEEK